MSDNNGISWAMETWLPVGGYEGLYEVSDQGRVRSLFFDPPRLLKLGTDQTGYPTVMLSKDSSIKHGGTRRPFTVHRLVALAFHNDKRNALHNEVAHLDGGRTNNAASNLKWVSRCENEFHKYGHGTKGNLTEQKVRDIMARLGTRSRREIADEFGISLSAVAHIARGTRWRHITLSQGEAL